MSGELKKLKIRAEDQPDLVYTALVNPESYTIKHGIVYNPSAPPAGVTGKDLQYHYTQPPDIQFDILFDSTGVIPQPLEGFAGALSGIPVAGAVAGAVQGAVSGLNKYDIIDEITKFKKVVYDYNSDKHSPRTVEIIWGTLYFKGKLTSLQFNYKLFHPDGSPIRVVATAAFTGTIEDDLRVALEKSNSPDLTHIRVVKKGDTLPLMTYKIYGNSSYYLEVARINKLKNFRNLEPGTKIKFPPLRKTKK